MSPEIPVSPKFTPGPWTFQADDTFSSLGDQRIVGADRISPAIVFGGICETEANARLIAAAPELLEAAKAMFRQMERPNPTHVASYRKRYELWKAAIAKAEGQ